jgi:hypothetical protein
MDATEVNGNGLAQRFRASQVTLLSAQQVLGCQQNQLNTAVHEPARLLRLQLC